MRSLTPLLAGAFIALLPACSPPPIPTTQKTDIERGRYLASIAACNDCHTPKRMTPQGPVPDSTRLLSGHRTDVAAPEAPKALMAPGGWAVATNEHLTAWAGPWGISFAANLTPDPTGLAGWTPEQFIKTLREGRHAGTGRPLLPPMPWPYYQQMTDEDLTALFAYLQSLPPIANQVPVPVAPDSAAS